MIRVGVVSERAARRAAQRVGYVARKSCCRRYSIDNLGAFQIVTPDNIVLAGSRFNLTAAEVVALCRDISSLASPSP